MTPTDVHTDTTNLRLLLDTEGVGIWQDTTDPEDTRWVIDVRGEVTTVDVPQDVDIDEDHRVVCVA